jgi:peptide/nickel transport system ATP-binding protein
MSEPLLEVEDLRVVFESAHGRVEAVRGVSFAVGREKVGIVGESGSGKTLTGRCVLRIPPPTAHVSAKRIAFRGEDLITASEARMRAIRGRHISMILQDPKFSLNPVMRVGEQVAESFRIHHPGSRREARDRALDMLGQVRIRDPKRVYDLYPHEVSGGMGQRIMIAMMLVPAPELLIADEPTSALDVTVRTQVLAILDDLVAERGLGLVFVSHDLNLVATFCDRVLVMYAGRIVEECAAGDLGQARHPYTRALLAATPRLDVPRERLAVMERDRAWLEA